MKDIRVGKKIFTNLHALIFSVTCTLYAVINIILMQDCHYRPGRGGGGVPLIF